MALDEADRLREEDPFTGIWTSVVDHAVVARRSRFEVDLNRPRERRCTGRLRTPGGCMSGRASCPTTWSGARSRSTTPSTRRPRRIFSELERRYGQFVVLDLHSYNHREAWPRRAGRRPAAEPRGERRHRLPRPRALGAAGRPLHVRPPRSRVPRAAPRRARERAVPGRAPGSLGPRELPRIRLLPGRRVQEVLHGRVDRTDLRRRSTRPSRRRYRTPWRASSTPWVRID